MCVENRMEYFFPSASSSSAKEGILQSIVSAIKECKSDATNAVSYDQIVSKKAECSFLPEQLEKDYPNMQITKEDITKLYVLISKLSDEELDALVAEHPMQGGGRRSRKTKTRKAKASKSKSTSRSKSRRSRS